MIFIKIHIVTDIEGIHVPKLFYSNAAHNITITLKSDQSKTNFILKERNQDQKHNWPDCRDIDQNGRDPAGGGPTEGRSWKTFPLVQGRLLLQLHPASQQQWPSVSALPPEALPDWHPQHCLCRHDGIDSVTGQASTYISSILELIYTAAYSAGRKVQKDKKKSNEITVCFHCSARLPTEQCSMTENWRPHTFFSLPAQLNNRLVQREVSMDVGSSLFVVFVT